MYAEKPVLVDPHGSGPEARTGGQPTQAVHRELVRVLGVQRLAFLDLMPLPPERDLLPAPADQMHLDALLRRVVERTVRELLQYEAGAQFTVGAGEQVAVLLGQKLIGRKTWGQK